MSPNLPDLLILDVRDCLNRMDLHTNGLRHFDADHRLALQYVMDIIHNPSMMESKIMAMELDIISSEELDSNSHQEALLLVNGLTELAISLHSKLKQFGVYDNGDYLTYQFYDLIKGNLAMNKIIISNPNEYFPSSGYILPAWVAGRIESQNKQFVTA